MTRITLPDRRECITKKVTWDTDTGTHSFYVSVGFEHGADQILEIFYASGMTDGSSLRAMASDACVMASMLLQHGETPQSIAKSLSSAPVLGVDRPASIIGAIVEAISK